MITFWLTATVVARMSWKAAEGMCLKKLIVGTSRVLDFNVDLCALQTLALRLNSPNHTATACSSSVARQVHCQLHNQSRHHCLGQAYTTEVLLLAPRAQSQVRPTAAQ
jgi:hypothetical protein